jgi:hypothetical protein
LILLSALVRSANGAFAIDHVDHDRRFARLGRGGLDHRVGVAEARVVSARHDAGNGRRRAFALIDGDVELFGGEIALVQSPEIPGVDTLQFPVEGEPDLGHILRAGAGEQEKEECQTGEE